MNRRIGTSIALSLLALMGPVAAAGAEVEGRWSLVVNHGRVIDPETGLDGTRHLGVRGDEIAVVSTTPLRGAKEIDATGLVVAPGFIDLHTHSPTPLGQYYQLFDGVTTALELEAGAFPVGRYGSRIDSEPLINFGASAGYLSMRLLHKQGLEAVHATEAPRPVSLRGWWTALKALFMPVNAALGATFREVASEEELGALRASLLRGLDEGGLGIGLALDYISEAVNEAELAMIFEVAAERRAPVFVHVRRGVNGDPAGLREALSLAKRHGAPLHVCHVSHNAMRNIDLFLAEIERARAEGVDVTTEVLPFNAGSAPITSAVFDRDWQTIFDIGYEDVEWAETGERFTRESWERVRREHPTSSVIHHYLTEEWTRRAVQAPGVIIVSDLMPMETREKKVAPHNGAFTKVLGSYVRDEHLLSLSEALEKMTLLPARRLERYAPQFERKGRIQPGADADITIFDPDRIAIRATYRDPYQEATGVEHVIVNGVHLVEGGRLLEGRYPGRRLSAPRP